MMVIHYDNECEYGFSNDYDEISESDLDRDVMSSSTVRLAQSSLCV